MALKTICNFPSGRLIIQAGDLTEANTEAIVNAANSSLLGGGGVDGAIHRKAGPELLSACQQIRKNNYPQGLPAGQAVITKGYKLLANYIIHTVGPIYSNDQAKAPQLLYACYQNSLFLAKQHNIKSISFPAISTGAYGYPFKEASEIANQAVRNYCNDFLLPEKIYFVFFTEEQANLFLTTVKAW